MLPDFDPILTSGAALDRNRAELRRQEHFRRGPGPLLLRHCGDSKARTLVSSFRSSFQKSLE